MEYLLVPVGLAPIHAELDSKASSFLSQSQPCAICTIRFEWWLGQFRFLSKKRGKNITGLTNQNYVRTMQFTTMCPESGNCVNANSDGSWPPVRIASTQPVCGTDPDKSGDKGAELAVLSR